MNVVITNVHLFKWKIANVTPYCTFCSEYMETDLHLFFECSIVKVVWQQVFDWLKQICPCKVTMNARNVLLNTVHPNPKNVCNVIVLIVKFNIYRARCFKQTPNIVHIQEDVAHHFKMELLGAMLKNKVRLCMEKWEGVLQIIQN